MKEIILCIALLLSFSLWTERQSNDAKGASTPRPLSFERDDECGIPLRESMLWMSVEGKVIKVVDGDTIILLTKDNRRKRVNLVAVDASAGQDAARSLLSRLEPASAGVANSIKVLASQRTKAHSLLRPPVDKELRLL